MSPISKINKPITSTNGVIDAIRPTPAHQKAPKPILSRQRSFHYHQDNLPRIPPAFTIALPLHVEVPDGQRLLELKVFVIGEPKPSIVWRKDDKEILVDGNDHFEIRYSKNSSVLLIHQVRSSDAGRYICCAESSQGKIDSFCNLKVQSGGHDTQSGSTARQAPVIADHLDCFIVEDGQSLDLACQITCPLSFDVVWLHNGKEIKPSNDFQYHNQGSKYFLKIPEIFPEDEGSYTCEAFNDFGECLSSCSVFVTCPPPSDDQQKSTASSIVPPPKFQLFPKSVTCQAGSVVDITSKVQVGESIPKIEWWKDGAKMSNPDQEISDENDEKTLELKLRLLSCSRQDSGLYELKLLTPDGAAKAQSAAFAINVLQIV